MSTEGVHRKLAAILCADVEGYSRLMQDDLEGTLHTLTDHREVFRRCTENRNGRIVDSPGDNILIEFSSATEAVQCAVEIQRELSKKNAELAEGRRMQFRIGVDLGELLEKDDALYGDGVNISARLQTHAESGGICISGRAYDQVVNRLPLKFEFLGKRSVKNIDHPIRVYQVLAKPGDAMNGLIQAKPQVPGKWSMIGVTIAAVLILIAGAGFIWQHYFQPSKINLVDTEETAPPLSEQIPVSADVQITPKSIAVLPFADLSPEKDQEYFVDGLIEELLNSLAKIPDLLVTARTSSFIFKESDKTAREIAGILGVAHILEGSVRKDGDKLRITAQLIRAADGFHLWSNTYDGELVDIFDVQEKIATAVANELKLKLGVGESHKQLGGTDNLEAYELYLVAKGHDATFETDPALELIDKALAIDPGFALAWSLKSNLHSLKTMNIPPDQIASEKDVCLSSIERAIELEPNLGEAWSRLGAYRTMEGDWINAELAFRKATELGGESSLGEGEYGNFLISVGHFQRFNKFLEYCLRNSPLDKHTRATYAASFAYSGDLERSEKEFERGRTLLGDEWFWGDVMMSTVRLTSGNVMSRDGIPLLPSFDPIWASARAYMESPEEGIAYLHRLVNEEEVFNTSSLFAIWNWAVYYGDYELAMDITERAVKQEPTMTHMVWPLAMKEVRQTSRFKKFVREVGLLDYWEQFGWPDLCHPTDDGDFVCD